MSNIMLSPALPLVHHTPISQKYNSSQLVHSQVQKAHIPHPTPLGPSLQAKEEFLKSALQSFDQTLIKLT